MPTTREIVWLAGLLEGEGTFGTSTMHGNNRKYSYGRIGLKMTDQDVVAKAARLLQARIYGPYLVKEKTKSGGFHKPFWTIILTGTRAIQWMMTLYPLMGLRRQQQIWVALMRWRTTNNLRTYKRKGALRAA